MEESITTILRELEFRCILNNFADFKLNSEVFWSNDLLTVLNRIIQTVTACNFKELLNLPISDYRLKIQKTNNFPLLYELQIETESILDENLNIYVHDIIFLLLGVSCLQEFFRSNACGPEAGQHQSYQICDDIVPSEQLTDEETLKLLDKNGETPLKNIINPKLLLLSHIFLNKVSDNQCVTHKWWMFRYYMIHQNILPDRVSSIHDAIIPLIESTLHMEWIEQDKNFQTKFLSDNNVLLKMLFYIECSQMHLFYHEVTQSREYINKALDLAGLNVELSGAKGRRTQFQERALPQLFVKIKRKNTVNIDLTTQFEDFLLEDVQLKDDTLLEQIAFVEDEDQEIHNLLPHEQLALLGFCCFVKKSTAADELLQEEITAFVNCLLFQPKVWPIYVKTLIMRCSLEKNSSRKLERGLKQLEAILHSLQSERPSFAVRFPFVYGVAFPMNWTLQKELADLLISIGLTKSALEIYEKLELWEDVVPCYQRLGRTSCAENLLKKRLEEKETPLLWCMLGDVMDDPAFYIKADDLSNGTNARCQRALGDYYYKRKDYEKSSTHFLKSVERNHLQPNVWFSLGYAAKMCENYELAARAYRQVVTLDHDNFQAWNNLSHAYIQTKQKERAWRSLQEALKCNYEECKVWENFLLVSIDIGAFEDAIRAFHRLLDLKDDYNDVEVIKILVDAINKDLKDFYGFPSCRLKKKMLELLGRLTSKVTNNSQLWEAYSMLQCPEDSPAVSNTEVQIESYSEIGGSVNKKIIHEDNHIVGKCKDNRDTTKVTLEAVEKALLHQQKAVRYAIHNQKCFSDYSSCSSVLKMTLRYANLSISYLQELENSMKKQQQQSSSKLNIQPVILRIHKVLQDFSDGEQEKLKEDISQLKSTLDIMLKL